MKIITVATHSQAYFPALKESAQRNTIDFVVLGWGEKWAGFGWKLKLIKNYLDGLPADETVLVIDAFDVLISSGSEEMESKFQRLNQPLVCAAERKHFSRIWNWAYELIFNKDGDYPDTVTIYNYLNAGSWMSTAGYALDLLNHAALENAVNDQALFTYLYTKGHVSIDYNCEIFTCIRTHRDLKYTNNRFQNKFTQTYPCIIHGPADVSMKKLISQLGLKPVNYSIRQHIWKYAYSIYAFRGSNRFNKDAWNQDSDTISENDIEQT